MQDEEVTFWNLVFVVAMHIFNGNEIASFCSKDLLQSLFVEVELLQIQCSLMSVSYHKSISIDQNTGC